MTITDLRDLTTSQGLKDIHREP